MVMASKRSGLRGTVEDVSGKKSKAGRTTGQLKTGEVEQVTLVMSDPTESRTKKGMSRPTPSNS